MKASTLYLGIPLLLAAGFLVKLLVDAGVFHEVASRGSLVCAPFRSSELEEPEDIAVSRKGVAFVSVRRGVVSLDLSSAPEMRPALSHLMEVIPDGPFHPHGLALSPSGSKLFVVNHAESGRDQIEVFSVAGALLSHERSIASPVNGNDLVAIDDHRFYLTRDHGASSSIGMTLEDYSRLGRGSVLYFDGARFETVASGISFANGIALDSSARPARLYVSAMLERRVRTYDVDLASGKLAETSGIPLAFGPDNLNWSEDGRLLIAGHPKLLELGKMRRVRSARSPSIAVALRPEHAEQQRLLFEDPGERIAASSVLADWRGRYLLGSVFDNRLLVCRDTTVNALTQRISHESSF